MKGETYNSINRLNLNQRIIKHLPQIRILSLRNLAKIIHQRRIKQAEFLAHSFQVSGHIIQTILPELPYEEPARTIFFIHSRDKLPQKVFREMLNSIKPNTLQCNLLTQPFAPVDNISFNFRMLVIEICEHEVIVITLLAIDISGFSPSFGLVAEDLVDGCFVVIGVVVCTGEVIPVVLLLRVLLSAAGEVEAEPGVDFVGVGDCLVSVILVNFLGFAFLFVVGCSFVVENWKGEESSAEACSEKGRYAYQHPNRYQVQPH